MNPVILTATSVAKRRITPSFTRCAVGRTLRLNLPIARVDPLLAVRLACDLLRSFINVLMFHTRRIQLGLGRVRTPEFLSTKGRRDLTLPFH